MRTQGDDAAEVLALHGAPSAVVSLAGHSLRRSLADTIGRPHDLVRLTGTNMLGPAALLLALLAPMSRATAFMLPIIGYVSSAPTTEHGMIGTSERIAADTKPPRPKRCSL